MRVDVASNLRDEDVCLGDADLRDADLRDADLRDALNGAVALANQDISTAGVRLNSVRCPLDLA